jgi:hypothetical protein
MAASNRPLSTPPPARCYTRALKNARQLQKMAPHIFAKDPQAEGFGTGVPMEILQGLHRMRHDSPVLSRHKEVADFLREQRLTVPTRKDARDALFSGTIHFAQVTFQTSGGNIVMPTADLNQIVQYAQHAIVALSEYAAQYGANTVTISPTLLAYTASVPTGSYTDGNLQGWVNDMVATNSLPTSSCIFVVSPQGLTAPNVGGNSGYHNRANIPYIVAGVFATGLTLADNPDVYAMVVSHEIAEMIVDPNVMAGDPEVCDPCDINCGNLTRCYFNLSDNFLGSNQATPPGGFTFSYYVCAVVKPTEAAKCPASSASCAYAPKPVLTSPRVTGGAQIGVVSRNTDKLDIFVTDEQGVIFTAAWEPAFTDWWHGWWELNGGRALRGAPVHGVSRSPDKLDAFVIGTDNRVYTAAWEPAFTDWWHGWWPLNNGIAAPGAHVTAVSRNTDKLDVFVVGTDGRVYTAAWEPAFTDWWHGWWPIGGIRVPQGAPVHAVSRSADKLDIFVTDVNGVIFTAAWEPAFTDGWHGWWELNGGRAAPGAHVTAVSRNTDKLDVFVVGTDGRVYTAAWEPAFTDWWHGWWPIGDIRVPQGAPVHAVSRMADKLDIFATDVNGAIMTAAWEPAFTDWWHGWWELNGGRAAPGGPVTAVSRSTDKLDAFVVGTDGRVWTAAWEPAFTDWWHGWWPIGE